MDALRPAIGELLTRLADVERELRHLSNAIWENIDHTDAESLQRGVALKQSFNQAHARFEGASAEMRRVLAPLGPARGAAGPGKDGPLRTLGLGDDGTFTRPVRFQIAQHAAKASTWRDVYVGACQALALLDGARFQKLPDLPQFRTSKRGDFSTDRTRLRYPAHVAHGVYAEVNLSANHIRDNLRKLLPHFGVRSETFSVEVRADDKENGSPPEGRLPGESGA